MSDIAERLRAGARMFQYSGNEEEELAQAATEAADEIERLSDEVESVANFLRGLCMDPAIPAHAKQAIGTRVARLDKLGGWDE